MLTVDQVKAAWALLLRETDIPSASTRAAMGAESTLLAVLDKVVDRLLDDVRGEFLSGKCLELFIFYAQVSICDHYFVSKCT